MILTYTLYGTDIRNDCQIIEIHKTAKPAFFLCANYCGMNIALYFPFGWSVNVMSQGGDAGMASPVHAVQCTAYEWL